MFKPFHLNKNYAFDFEGNCSINGNLLETKDDFIEIEISGVVRKLDRTWLGLISHYEVKFDFETILNIEFIPCESRVIRLKCKKLMFIKYPIKIGSGFRIIPGFPSFAINSFGIVKSLIRNPNKILKKNIGPYGYPYVNIYDPDKGTWRGVSVHILLARAFIKNSDIESKFFVNHKDGIKTNYSLSNLEWVTSKENNDHAVKSGLRVDNKACKLYDSITGDVKIFTSITEALLSTGTKKTNRPMFKIVDGIKIPYLIMKRYEIKEITDKSSWFYSNSDNLKRKIILQGPYEAKNILTGIIIEAMSIEQLSVKLEISGDRIAHQLRSSKIKVTDNFLIRIKTDDVWPVEYTDTIHHSVRKMKITNVTTGEIINFNSGGKMRSFLGIDKKTVKLRLQSKLPYKGWFIENEH